MKRPSFLAAFNDKVAPVLASLNKDVWILYRRWLFEKEDIGVNIDELDVTDETPCWVAFRNDESETDTLENIPVCFKEEEAATWILRGWDVGHLPRGVAHPEETKWLT